MCITVSHVINIKVRVIRFNIKHGISTILKCIYPFNLLIFAAITITLLEWIKRLLFELIIYGMVHSYL